MASWPDRTARPLCGFAAAIIFSARETMDRRIEEPQADPAAHYHVKEKRRRKSIIGIVIALVLLAALGWLVWHLTHANNAGPAAGGMRPGGPGGRGGPATTVGVATAERADIPVTLEALGTVPPSATATVRPQVSGVLQKISFKEGETVKAVQLLSVIDPRQFEMALMQAAGQRQRDEAQLDNARITLKRYQTLLEQDSIARQDVDTQAALVKQLEGTVTADRAQEGTAKLNLGYSKINAPIGGRIGLRTVDIGNLESANDANGIAVITQVSQIEVAIAVPQDLVPDLHARIGDGGPLQVTAFDRTLAAALDSGRFLALDIQFVTQTC